MELITILFFIILTSFFLGKIFQKIQIPKILAPIFVGIFFSIFNQILPNNQKILEFLSELGIIMLLFYIGLELDINAFKRKNKETFTVAFLGILICFILGFLTSYYLLNFSFVVSFVVASTLSITAEGVMAVLLEETHLIKSKVGNVILGAGIIDDIAGIFLLVIISFLASGTQFTIQAIWPFLIGIFVFLLIFIFFRNILKFVGDIFLENQSNNYYDIFTLAIILVLALAGFSHYAGFDFSIGAIFAGVLINIALRKKGKKGILEEHTIDKFIKAMTFGFLSYVFFFWIGYEMDITTLGINSANGFILSQNLVYAFIFCVIGFLGKILSGLALNFLYNTPFKDGVLIGLGMSTKGAVELVIANIALGAGLIEKDLYTSIVLMGIILTVLPPIFFKRIANKKNKTNRKIY